MSTPSSCDNNNKSALSPLEYQVTQCGGTEPPFDNRYWDHKEKGLYVDIVTGEPLFLSIHKYDSGTGWPSFTRTVDTKCFRIKLDFSHQSIRTEVLSQKGGCHLGHLFSDGPRGTKSLLDSSGFRFCINSAALRFVSHREILATPREYQTYNEILESKIHLKPFLEQLTRSTAYLGGGCFWGMEELFRKLTGVVDTDVGYMGGSTDQPIYEEVKSGKTGHAETLKITFYEEILPYEELLRFFFAIHDPTTPNQQGHDLGSQYRSEIFVLNETQKKTAERLLELAHQSWNRPVSTKITTESTFWAAEDFHQDYLQNHPEGYTCHFIRWDKVPLSSRR